MLTKNGKRIGNGTATPTLPKKPAVKFRVCATCSGTGQWVLNRTGEVGDFDAEECPDCNGTGRRKVTE